MRKFAVRLLVGICMAGGAAAETLDSARTKFEARDPQALPALEALAQSAPKDAEVRLLLGRAQARAKQLEAAEKTLEQAVGLNPRSAEANFRLGQVYAARINQVGMFGKMSMAKQIRDSFQRAVDLDPDLHDARLGLVQFYVAAPGIAGGSPEKAAVEAAELARRNPARGHAARAIILGAEKKTVEAMAALEAAVTADAAYRNGWLMLGAAYARAERWEDAFGTYRKLLALNADDGAALYQLGRVSALSGMHAGDGIGALERYLRLPADENTPGPSGAHFRIGMIHAKSGRIAEARAAYQMALKLDPKNEDAKAELANLKG